MRAAKLADILDKKNGLYQLADRKNRKIELPQTYVRVGTCKNPWVLSIRAHHDNPYDRATLKERLYKAPKHSDAKIEQAFADKAYRGKGRHPDDIKIYISGKKNLPFSIKKRLKGHSGIEPVIGHLKQDHRLDRNYLLGKIGDKINAVLAGCGFNLRKILNCIKLNQTCFA